MKKTIGNFLLQGNKDFPVDCELFDNIQINMDIVQIIGNLAGNKTILKGCEPVGNSRNPGYVFLCTKDYPNGEVLYFEGGSTASGMYVRLEDIAVSQQGYNYPKAYTVRSLAPGIGSENYMWGDFKTVKTPAELEEMIKEQEEKIKALAPSPLGIPDIWAGNTIPKGYVLCDGQELRIIDYPELYAVLGTLYNNAYDYRGSRYSTQTGCFRVPDLRGRFIVGHHSSDTDYNKYGSVGGVKKHTLSTDEMPSHVHKTKDYYYIEHTDYLSYGGIDGTEVVSGQHVGGGKTDRDNNLLFYKEHDTYSVGKGAAHENRPPFYTLAYIMRTK